MADETNEKRSNKLVSLEMSLEMAKSAFFERSIRRKLLPSTVKIETIPLI